MAIEIENFRPVTELLPVVRRDVGLEDKTLADPSNALTLVDGEWMAVNENNRAERAVDIASAGNEPVALNTFTKLLYPLWAETGRFDVQANYEKKTPLIYLGGYEFETLIFDPTVTIGGAGGAAISSIHQPVKVASIDIGGKKLSGLVGGSASATGTVVGFVTRLHTDNGGWLRFRGGFGW